MNDNNDETKEYELLPESIYPLPDFLNKYKLHFKLMDYSLDILNKIIINKGNTKHKLEWYTNIDFISIYNIEDYMENIYNIIENVNTSIKDNNIEKDNNILCENLYDLYNSNRKGINKKMIYWSLMMIVNIKYVSIILELYILSLIEDNNILSTDNDEIDILSIDNDEIFVKPIKCINNINNIKNILLLSLINNDIREIIIKYYGLQKYTKLLLNTSDFILPEQNENCITYIEIASGFGILTNLLNNNQVDIDILINERYTFSRNLLHLILADLNEYACCYKYIKEDNFNEQNMLNDSIINKLKILIYDIDINYAKPIDICYNICDDSNPISKLINYKLTYKYLIKFYDNYTLFDNVYLLKCYINDNIIYHNVHLYITILIKQLHKSNINLEEYKKRLNIIFILIYNAKQYCKEDFKMLFDILKNSNLINEDNLMTYYGNDKYNLCYLDLVPVINNDNQLYVTKYINMIINKYKESSNNNYIYFNTYICIFDINFLLNKNNKNNIIIDNFLKITQNIFDINVDNIVYERLAYEFNMFEHDYNLSIHYNKEYCIITDLFNKSIINNHYYLDVMNCISNNQLIYRDRTEEEFKYFFNNIILYKNNSVIEYILNNKKYLKNNIQNNNQVNYLLNLDDEYIIDNIFNISINLNILLGDTHDELYKTIYYIIYKIPYQIFINHEQIYNYVLNKQHIVIEFILYICNNNIEKLKQINNILQLNNDFIFNSNIIDNCINKPHNIIIYIFDIWIPTPNQYKYLKKIINILETPHKNNIILIYLLSHNYITTEYYDDYDEVFHDILLYILINGKIDEYYDNNYIKLTDLLKPENLKMILSMSNTINFFNSSLDEFIEVFNNYREMYITKDIIKKMSKNVIVSLAELELFNQTDLNLYLDNINLFIYIINKYDECNIPKYTFFDNYITQDLIIEHFNNILKSSDGYNYIIKYMNETNLEEIDISLYNPILLLPLFEKYVDNNIINNARYIYFYYDDMFSNYYKSVTTIKHRISYLLYCNININNDIKNIKTRDDIELIDIIYIINNNIYIGTIDLVKIFPELIHTELIDKEIVDDIIIQSINDENIYKYIISYSNKSVNIIDQILNIYFNNDFIQYLYVICELNIDVIHELNKNKEDTLYKLNKIKELASNNMYILNKIINTNIFTDYEIITFKNRIGDYSISILDDIDLVNKYIDLYTFENMLEFNKLDNPCLFSFLTSKIKTEQIINKFGINTLSEIYDKNGNNIYMYLINFGLYDLIPINKYMIVNNYKKNIIMILCESNESDDKIIDIITKIELEKGLEIYKSQDCLGLTCIHYIIKYRSNIFEQLIKNQIITKNILYTTNFDNETYLMWGLKTNHINAKILINHTELLDDLNLYSNSYSGSVLTYSIKYASHMFDDILHLPIFNEDVFMIKNYVNNIIDISDDNHTSGNILLNILQIAVIFNHDILSKLLLIKRKYINILFNELITIGSNTYNLLSLALYNNPDAVYVILCSDLCNTQYLLHTEKLIGNFQNIIDIQPGSWYYLLKCTKLTNILTINTDDYYYNYNYKLFMTHLQINEVKHYIIAKQELSKTYDNTCIYCTIYKNKVIFTNCKHICCIVCALKNSKCPLCKNKLEQHTKQLLCY